MNRILAQFIDKWYTNDESRIVIIYGTAGIGKSSYAIQTCLELDEKYHYGFMDYIVFRPQDFIDKVTYLYNHNLRIPALVWDDAGVWLYKQDYLDEFVKSAVKFFNVARTIVSCIILTTISPNMLITGVKKLDAMTIKIVKSGHPKKSLARCYATSYTPTGYRMLKTIFEDEYSRYMPDEIYATYQKMRMKYVKEAIDLMMNSVTNKQIDNNLSYLMLNFDNGYKEAAITDINTARDWISNNDTDA